MPYRLVMTIALCALFGLAAQAQTSRVIKFVVPFAPGGTADILARLLAEEIGKAHGVGTLIENRAGAGTIIATEAASRAAPDGNTVLFNANAIRHQSAFAKALLRSPDKLRAALPARVVPASDRGWRRRALPQSDGDVRCGARQARRIDPRQRRAGEHPAHRVRNAQAPRQREHDLRAIQRQWIGGECAPWKTRRFGPRELFRSRGAIAGRHVSRARHNVAAASASCRKCRRSPSSVSTISRPKSGL